MALRQILVVASLDMTENVWKAEIGDRTVRGSLALIVEQLTREGWEIVTTTPIHWSATTQNKLVGPGLVDSSWSSSSLDVIGIIVRAPS